MAANEDNEPKTSSRLKVLNCGIIQLCWIVGNILNVIF